MSAVSILRSGEVLASDVRWAGTLISRSRGLLGYPPLAPGQGLVIEPGGQVHTFGMTYPIDVVFCDRSGAVLHIVRALKPRRVTRWVRRARFAIELPVGSVPMTLEPGDRLVLGVNEGSRPNR